METATKMMATTDAFFLLLVAFLPVIILAVATSFWFVRRLKLSESHWLSHAIPGAALWVVLLIAVVIFQLIVNWIWSWQLS